MTRVRRILARAGSPRARVRAYAFQSKEAPAEIQLWNAGDNPTDYGVHKWTERSIREVVARYNERGNPLLIDVEHNGAVDEGEPTVTGGYARLDIRDGAPWLVFDWSSYALDQIASRQRLFISPEYDVDADTNEITALYRVSLVADPGTHRARVLARAASITATARGNGMDPTIAAIVSLLDSVSDPAAAIDAVRGFISNLPSADAVVDDTPTVDPVATTTPAFASAPQPDEEKKQPVAASAATAAATAAVVTTTNTVVMSETAAESEAAKTARVYAQQSENALRDSILLRDGHRLAPSIRKWASSQSLAVVRGLCAAAPEVVEPAATRVAATRGVTQGTGDVPKKGLEGRDLEEMERAFGTYRASAPTKPYTNERGEFVLPSLTPTEHRRVLAAAASKEGK